MGDQSFNKNDDNKNLATGVDTGAIGPGGEVQNGSKPNPQTEEVRSFKTEQGEGGEGSGERIDTDGDGRTRDVNDTRPSDHGGKDAPVQR